jgi:hypothetical protein
MERVHWEIDKAAPTLGRFRRFVATLRHSVDRHPFTWSSFVQAAIFITAWVASSVTLFPNVTGFHVRDPASVIATAWQVLAGFASIAFAGLAVLMQLTSEPVVTSRGVRQVLFQECQFRAVLAFSIAGAVQIGAAALFLDEPEAAVVEVIVVAATVLWIGWSYARVGAVYAYPGEALRLGEVALLRDLKASMRQAHAQAVGEARLHTIVAREWRWSASTTVDGVVLVRAGRTAVLMDIDIDLLSDIVKEVADNDTTAFAASDAPAAPGEPATANAPELRIMASIGSSIDSGQEIYLLKNCESYSGDVTRLRGRLSKTLRWEGKA